MWYPKDPKSKTAINSWACWGSVWKGCFEWMPFTIFTGPRSLVDWAWSSHSRRSIPGWAIYMGGFGARLWRSCFTKSNQQTTNHHSPPNTIILTSYESPTRYENHTTCIPFQQTTIKNETSSSFSVLNMPPGLSNIFPDPVFVPIVGHGNILPMKLMKKHMKSPAVAGFYHPIPSLFLCNKFCPPFLPKYAKLDINL